MDYRYAATVTEGAEPVNMDHHYARQAHRSESSALAHAQAQQKAEEALFKALETKSSQKKQSCELGLAVENNNMCQRLICQKVARDERWRVLAQRHWDQYCHKLKHGDIRNDPLIHQNVYRKIVSDIERLDFNWRNCHFTEQSIAYSQRLGDVAVSLQFDRDRLACGFNDGTIRIWDRRNLSASPRVLMAHTKHVCCLQLEGDLLISGSADREVKLWDMKAGELKASAFYPAEVVGLRFRDGVLITCGMQDIVYVWTVKNFSMTLTNLLSSHTGFVFSVDFDNKYIVSASVDKTVKVWGTAKGDLLWTLEGHTGPVFSVQYRNNLVVSASSDETIRVWNVESGVCLKVLLPHDGKTGGIFSLHFDGERVVSGDHEGRVKFWNVKEALASTEPGRNFCAFTLKDNTSVIQAIQFDHFSLVTSSGDGTIAFRDFLQRPMPEKAQVKMPGEDLALDGVDDLVLDQCFYRLVTTPNFKVFL